MSGPGTAHRKRVGKTTDHHSVAVYVSREVTLNEELSTIVWRRLRGIDVVVRDGFQDATSITLTRAQAQRLCEALDAALKDTALDSENFGASW